MSGLLRQEEQRHLPGPCTWQSTQLPREVSVSSTVSYTPDLKLTQFK